MQFKKLTHINGNEIYINFGNVTTINVDNGGRTIIFYSGEDYDIVRESPDTIFEIESEEMW